MRQRRKLLVTLTLGLWGWGLWVPVWSQLQPNQRYLALLLLNLTENEQNLDLIEESVKAGMNAVHLTIPWDYVYPTATSTPNWRTYDNQINLAQRLGVKVALRIHLGRNEGRLQGFWRPEERQQDFKNKVLSSGYAATFFSYAHRPSVEQARNFIKEVCQRYNAVQQQGGMAWVSVTTTPTQELGYHYDNFSDNHLYSAVFDYSPPMVQEFRTWLSRKYKKIARLNAIWQTEFSDFDKIVPPQPPRNLNQVFWGEQGQDWYVFRHAILKQFIEQTTQTIKSVNANYKVVTDFGSVFDELAPFRGSYGFVDLNRLTDGIKSNDAIEFDNKFSADVVRSNARADQWVLNELFASLQQVPIAEFQKQLDENFENGNHWISVVVANKAELERIRSLTQTTVNRWIKTPYVPVVPRATMTYSLANIVEFGYFGGGVYSEWARKAGPEGVRQPVELKLIEDILADTLQGTLNRVPFVKNPIPNKIVRVNTPFTYRISSEVFSDIDGQIVGITAINLPNWLKYSNGVLTGTPSQNGTYTFTLRATDDDGAAVETSFTIVVDNTGRVNQRPTIRKPLKEVIGLYKQPFILTLADSLFADTDGFIAKIELTGLPTWAQYRRNEIRGVPDTAQVYTINVRAIDDEDAFVETTFKIIINYPTIFLDLMQAGKPGQRFLLRRIQPNATIPVESLPPFLNLYASCDANFDAFDLTLTGPYRRTIYTKRSPFSLFEGDEGFPTVVGSYQVQAKAYFRKELIAFKTIQFQLSNIDPITQKPLPIADWVAYPNPCINFLNLKLPDNSIPKQIELNNLMGVKRVIDERYFNIQNQTLTIDFDGLSVGGGFYFLKIQNEDDSVKVLKVFKL